MTHDREQAGTGGRTEETPAERIRTAESRAADFRSADASAEEIAEYVTVVRQALADLPEAQREELLEDLPSHLAEVAAEGSGSLADRLGPPAAYAAELRSAAEPPPAGGVPPRRARISAARAWMGGTLARLDARGGPLLGYERVSDFGRLLIPGWWVLRGYLAAMVVVTLLDSRGQLGLLPRLGGSTLAGGVILVGFVVASVWLGRRTPSLSRWPRRVLYPVTGLLVLVAIAGFAGLDANSRWGYIADTTYVYNDSYEHVEDVYVVDENDRLLTDVRLLDQNGDPIEIGWIWCERLDEVGNTQADPLTYPRCPEQVRWWARALIDAKPDPEAGSGTGTDTSSGTDTSADSSSGPDTSIDSSTDTSVEAEGEAGSPAPSPSLAPTPGTESTPEVSPNS